MTGYASVDTAVQALKVGAYDYITKPVDPDELSHLVANALEHKRARREVVRLRENLKEAGPGTELIGQSPAMKKVVELIEMVAPTEATVLITGESGTGKEVVARAIHAASPRRYMPMVTIHCGALTETLLESELFGHEKGAFTGAQYRKKGKFEVADGGTVFLDEISDISLQDPDRPAARAAGKGNRAGGRQPADQGGLPRHRRHQQEPGDRWSRQGTFRPDLYYRLHVFCIDLPPLRDAARGHPAAGQPLPQQVLHGHQPPGAAALARKPWRSLMRHDWPGNVRELENAVERALVVGRGPEIRPADFSFQFQADEPAAGRPWTISSGPTSSAFCARRSTTSRARRASWISTAPRCTTSCGATDCGEADPPHPAFERLSGRLGAAAGGARAARQRPGAHLPHALPHPPGDLRRRPPSTTRRGQYYSTAILQQMERAADPTRACWASPAATSTCPC